MKWNNFSDSNFEKISKKNNFSYDCESKRGDKKRRVVERTQSRKVKDYNRTI